MAAAPQAQGAAGGQGAAGIPSISARIPGIDICPIYYISTHGLYQMDRYKSGSTPLIINVPRDMIVIETSNIGESCYFTNFKEIIQPLLYDRPRLLQYLSGQPPADDNLELQFIRIGALNSCHIYLPGMPIANRILTLETGSREGQHPVNEGMRMEGARSSPFRDMTFLKYDYGKHPVRVLEHVHAKLIQEAHGFHDPTSKKANAWVKGEATETYETMFQHISRSAGHQTTIAIFPSCGTLFPSKPKQGAEVDREEINEIIKAQGAADAAWTAFIGISIKALYETLNGLYKGAKGVGNAVQVVGANKYRANVLPKHHVAPPVPPLQMVLRSAAAAQAPQAQDNGMSGGRKKSRRVKRSSKRFRKHKKTRKTL